MTSFPERRRSPPALACLRPEYRADSQLLNRLLARCERAKITLTGLRLIMLHGLLRAGENVTAVALWKVLMEIVDGPPPSAGSIQRNLNIFVDRGILTRTVGADRIWRYRIAQGMEPDGPTVLFIDAGTGRMRPCDLPEVTSFLHRLAERRGLDIRSAAITLQMDTSQPLS
ncbi:Fur family transcriptional regulator [Acetobacter senegalensis]|uniref:Fur family transcriptional regulator n=1 Tax=Acetobacter senegalensis TaxID=446692 RepID=UPI001EDB60D6|nr:Fur family transcriptional regulator [Acetobacter senegalensis]MCG4272589.1 Fur family transcriptional regulator [Acetobacter senegalensis]